MEFKINHVEFKGRYITRNGTLVAVHLNPGATKGNRVERYLGHSIPSEHSNIELVPFKICWNENGEAVWLQGIEETLMGISLLKHSTNEVKEYDLMEACLGDKWSRERGIRLKGCGCSDDLAHSEGAHGDWASS